MDTTYITYTISKNILWIAYKTGEGASRLVIYTATKTLPLITHKTDFNYKIIESCDEYYIIELV
jgi:hypothetical protein